jgi:hypothetical protein
MRGWKAVRSEKSSSRCEAALVGYLGSSYECRQVPSNPGIDEMMYTVGISYHLHNRKSAD